MNGGAGSQRPDSGGRPNSGGGSGEEQTAAESGAMQPTTGMTRWPRRLMQWLNRLFLHNGLLKLVSLVLAIALFFMVNTNKDVIIGVNIGVSYELPRDRIMISKRVDRVGLTLKGSPNRIRRFDERELDRIVVDLTDGSSGLHTFSKDQVRLPDGLTLLSINPPTIDIVFEPMAEKTVPVIVRTAGDPARGYQVAQITPNPPQVAIRGAQSVVRLVDKVPTRELRLDDRKSSFTVSIPIELPRNTQGGIEVVDRQSIEISVRIIEQPATRTVRNVPVQVVAGEREPTPGRYVTDPSTVDVVLHGPLLTIEALEGELLAEVRLYAEDAAGRARQAAVQVANVPAGVGIEVKPALVTLRPIR